tara:strand:+ start:2348 stop:3250 length:903 start_codon:yes stop_codon:yes gene_type:complete
MEYSEIANIIKESKPNLKDTSIKQYVSSLKNLNKKITGSDLLVNFEFVKNKDKVLDSIKDLHITSQRNRLISIITILDDEPLKEFYGKKVQELNKQQTENYNNNIVSDNTNFKLQNWCCQDIEKCINHLKIKQQFDTALLLSLIYHYLFRNEVASLKLIKKSKYDKLTEEQKLKNNFIVKHYSNMFISRGVYKTDKKHGLVLTKVEDKMLKMDLLQYIKNMKTDEFFPNMSQELVSKRISRATCEFKDPLEKNPQYGLGTSSINKIVIDSLPGIEKLVEISKDRGTSISTLLLAYFNNHS